MAASKVTNFLFQIFIVMIMIDMAIRYYLGPGPNMLSKKQPSKPAKENKYENPLKDVEIDTSLEEDDDNFAEPKKQKKKNKKKDTKEKEEEKEKEKDKEKKKKKKKVKDEDDDDDDDEDVDKQIITIIYDKRSFGKYYENLKNEIMGNFTNIDVEEKEYPLPSNKRFLSKFTFFSQIGINIFIFMGQKFKDKITMIPPSVFDGIEKNKWFIALGNLFFHQWLNRNLSTTGAFEIYFKDKIIFSKLSSNTLPREKDIHKQIKKLNKKYKGKGKKKKHVDYEDDDDEDL